MAYLPVKWFDYDKLLAAGGQVPTLTGQAGSLISLLTACLVDGFNVKVPQSITVSNGVGTVTFGSSGHGFIAHQVVNIRGADQSAINGDWRVLSVASTSITLDMSGVADGTATGSLDIRAAPLGWSRPFTGTNKAAFRSMAPDATGCYLRVDDTVGTYARVHGYESMTGVDIGTGMFPTTTQRTESNWGKSNTADATARKWTIIGDDRLFYFIVHTGYDNVSSYPNNRIGVVFGDVVSFKSGDAYGCIISSSSIDSSGLNQGESYGNVLHMSNDFSSSSRAFIARAHTQVGQSVSAWFYGLMQGSSGLSQLSYPSQVDNGLYISKGKFIVEDGQALRGELPGYYSLMQYRPLTHGVIVDGVIHGRSIMIIGVAYNWGNYDYSARFAIDITGPWR